LLLPGQDRYHGDICVSAATGSGKTLGYVLPVVEALKENLITRLRAIIVVPTRELVAQARQVAELCATGTGVKLGTALGSTPLANEQRQLVNKGQRFDLDIAKKLNEIAKERFKTGLDEEDSLMEDIQTLLPGHVPEYSSNVDILVCTPGRLVDHIRSTPGFSLSHVEYLIIDEADRLLDESFQEWVEVVLGALEKPDEDSARDRLLYNLEPRRLSKSVRKIILSATMTRDLAKLAMLKLRRPTLVAVTAGDRTPSEKEHGALRREDTAMMEAVDIPPNLREVAIPVRDGTLKPLYLLELLTRLLNSACASTSNAPAALKTRSNASDMVAQEDIDSGAVDSSDSSSETDDSDSDSTSDSETGKRELEDIDMPDTVEATTQLEGKGMPTARILVFTNNNEDVMRLSHILSALHLPYARSVGTLTKASSSTGRKTLAAFKSGKLAVLIATDRASRGLDVPDLTDVISYDMPRSVTSYVHRIGRTARAGKAGSAWTFFINTEARWFWNSIARGQEIRRSQAKVERMKIDSQGFEDKMPAYEHALKSLQSSVHGTK
jgi:ATP-dependent RNA helicase DDX51/DBP6